MQPLAKLLQNASDLTRIEDNAKSGSKRKLRQEVLDIQRLKDVGKTQPVSTPNQAPTTKLTCPSPPSTL
jgi:U3 small nucleolar RNA-associated protein 18